jgi:hypothetical protein
VPSIKVLTATANWDFASRPANFASHPASKKKRAAIADGTL